MKKILSIISVFSLFLLYSCEKNVITYSSADLDLDQYAQVKIVYDLPIVSSSAHNITKLTINDMLYSELGTSLGGNRPDYVGTYFYVPLGTAKIDAFKTSSRDVPVYSGTFNSEKGKWSAYIYNVNEPPLLVQDPERFETGSPWADTLAYVRFVNLFHKEDGVTPYGPLTLKVERNVNGTSQWVDVATCGFKEASSYNPINLNRKGISIWSGTESSMVFALFDVNGNQLQYFSKSSATTKSDYKATGYSLTKGVNYIFHLNGKEGTAYSSQALRLSTIAVN